MKRTLLVMAAGLTLLIGGSAHALIISGVSNATLDGGVVTLTVDNDDATALTGYSIVFDYDTGVSANWSATIVYDGSASTSGDPNFGFGSAIDCTIDGQCQGANGGGFSGAEEITNSVMTFTATGLAPGTLVQWALDGAHGGTESNLQGVISTDISGSFTVVPEPMTAGLLALGLTGLAIAGRGRR